MPTTNRGGLLKVEWTPDNGSTLNDLGIIDRRDYNPPEEEAEEAELMDGTVTPSWLRANFGFLCREIVKTEVTDLRAKSDANERIHFKFTSVDSGVVSEVPNFNQPGLIPIIETGPIQEPGIYSFVRVRGTSSGPTHEYVMSVTAT